MLGISHLSNLIYSIINTNRRLAKAEKYNFTTIKNHSFHDRYYIESQVNSQL